MHVPAASYDGDGEAVRNAFRRPPVMRPTGSEPRRDVPLPDPALPGTLEGACVGNLGDQEAQDVYACREADAGQEVLLTAEDLRLLIAQRADAAPAAGEGRVAGPRPGHARVSEGGDLDR